jgi:hypothetical protein
MRTLHTDIMAALPEPQSHSNMVPKASERLKRNVGDSLKKIVAAEQKWTCAHCQQLLPSTFEVDHIKALYLGGTNDRENLQALCPNCHRRKTVEEELAYRAQKVQDQRLEVYRTQINLYFEKADPDTSDAATPGAPFPLVKHVLTDFCGWPSAEVEPRLASLGHVADGAGSALFPAAIWRAVWTAAGVPSPHPTRCATVHTLRLRSSATAVFRSEMEAKRLRAAKAARSRQTAAGLASRAARSAPPSPARGDGLMAAPNAALFEKFRFNA